MSSFVKYAPPSLCRVMVLLNIYLQQIKQNTYCCNFLVVNKGNIYNGLFALLNKMAMSSRKKILSAIAAAGLSFGANVLAQDTPNDSVFIPAENSCVIQAEDAPTWNWNDGNYDSCERVRIKDAQLYPDNGTDYWMQMRDVPNSKIHNSLFLTQEANFSEQFIKDNDKYCVNGVEKNEKTYAQWTDCTKDGLMDTGWRLDERYDIIIDNRDNFRATYDKDNAGKFLMDNTPETAKPCPENVVSRAEPKEIPPLVLPPQECYAPKQECTQPSLSNCAFLEKLVQEHCPETTSKAEEVIVQKIPEYRTPNSTLETIPADIAPEILPQCTVDQLNNWVAYNGQEAKQASKQSNAKVLKTPQGNKTIYHVNHGGGNFDMVVLDGLNASFDEHADGSLDEQFLITKSDKLEKWLFDEIYGSNRHVDSVAITDINRTDYTGLRATLNKEAIAKLGSDCTLDTVVQAPIEPVEYTPRQGDITANKWHAYGLDLQSLDFDQPAFNKFLGVDEAYLTFGGFFTGGGGKQTDKNKHMLYDYDFSLDFGRDGNARGCYAGCGYSYYDAGKRIFTFSAEGEMTWYTRLGGKDDDDDSGVHGGLGIHGNFDFISRTSSINNNWRGMNYYGYNSYNNSNRETTLSAQVGPHADLLFGDPLDQNFLLRVGLNGTLIRDGFYGGSETYFGGSVFLKAAYNNVFNNEDADPANDGRTSLFVMGEVGTDFSGNSLYQSDFTAVSGGGEVIFPAFGRKLYAGASVKAGTADFGFGGSQDFIGFDLRLGLADFQQTRTCDESDIARKVANAPYKNAPKVDCI